MIWAIFAVITGFLFSANLVSAVSVSISNVPSTITDQPFTFDVSITGAQNGTTNYLRADFFEPNTTNYFGYTFNGQDWYNGLEYSQYFPVQITSSGYSGTMQAKIDTSSSKYKGNGIYNLRVRRYTQSGSYINGESNIVSLNVNITQTTSSPTPTPTQTSTSTPSPTSSSNSTLFTISNTPSQINSNELLSVSVNLSLPNNPNTKFYLKGAFRHPDKPSNYFGFTKVSGNWVKNGEGYTDQFPLTTNSSGNWAGNIDVKPDSEDSGFSGTGDYIFKVGRYKESDNPSVVWTNEANLKINSVETNSEGGSTNTTGASSTIKSSPSSTTQSKQTTSLSKTSNSIVNRTASVLGATQSATPSATPEIKVEGQNVRKPFFNIWVLLGAILIIAGIGSIGFVYLRNKP